MRTHDQRILGFYDTTPRTKMMSKLYGDPAAAQQAYDDLQQLPFYDDDDDDLSDNDDPDERSDALSYHPEGTVIMDRQVFFCTSPS